MGNWVILKLIYCSVHKYFASTKNSSLSEVHLNSLLMSSDLSSIPWIAPCKECKLSLMTRDTLKELLGNDLQISMHVAGLITDGNELGKNLHKCTEKYLANVTFLGIVCYLITERTLVLPW